jgi:uncharacterized membrane protein
MLGYDWTRLHAVLNDLPAALLVATVFFDLLGAVTRRPIFRQVGFWTLMLGVVGGAAAILSGLQAQDAIAHGSAVHKIMEEHEHLAFWTMGVFGLLAAWRIFRENRMRGAERAASGVLALAGIALLLATGMHGGELVFEHAAGIPNAVLSDELANRTAGHTHGGNDHAEGAAPEKEPAHEEEPAHEHGPEAAPARTTPADSARPAAPHTHAPGTPPHKD